MAVASLRYDATSNVDETRQGIFVHNGDATRFHEWEFRTQIRWSSSKDEDKPRAMAQIVEGLRGEAALTAMDVGLVILMGKDGLDKLLLAMSSRVFPQARAEAKELYQVGQEPKGPLARQSGEPSDSYV